MPIPSTIKVGAYAYKVVRATRRDLGDELGRCANDQLKIFIRKYLRKGKAREVLVHEVLHACHYLAGRSEKDKLTAEQWVESSTHGLLQVIRDNSELLSYLSE